MAEIKWKVFEHRGSQAPGKHPIMVGYKSIGSGLGKVVCASPLYDLRDFNLDGTASFLEKAYASAWWDPYELNSLLMPAADADFKMEAALAVKDYEFFDQARRGFLEQVYKATARAAVTIAVERFLSPGIEMNLAKTALEALGAKGQVAQFIVQTSLETIIMESICKASM